jgi:flagellin
MSLNISTNTAALRAGTQLGINQKHLQKSFDRLASGTKLSSPVDDPGGLAVSMKLSAAINRISGAQNNIQNAISFMEVQDGMLDTVGQIIDRMSELKGLSSQDPMKSDQDRASYNNEFKDLQAQLYDISQMKFNGVSLFAEHTNDGGQAKFSGTADFSGSDNTLTIFTSAEGAAGSKVSIHKAVLLSALTFNTRTLIADEFTNSQNGTFTGTSEGDETQDLVATFAVNTSDPTTAFLNLQDISVGVISQALENVAFLRAQNGGVHSRLAFNAQSLTQQKTNMRAALGRMVDVDIAEETTNLAKYSVLSQASASMLAQANQNTDIALMLLR